MERRLAAILAADVVGYSRLMEADEAATLATMKAHRQKRKADCWKAQADDSLHSASNQKCSDHCENGEGIKHPAKLPRESSGQKPSRKVSLWLQGDIQPPEIDFRFAPESRHSRGRH